MTLIHAYAPASIGNISCGFDTLGLCLKVPGDIVSLSPNTDSCLNITSIEGGSPDLPYDPDKNCATVAIKSALVAMGKKDEGFDIAIKKGIPGGSGMGSSAASAVAGVVALNAYFENPLSPKELLSHALQGELIASKSVHFDNIAPSLLGGITLIHDDHGERIYNLPIPEDLHLTVISPAVTIHTADARALIPKSITLGDTKQQMRDIATFVHALHSGDLDALAASLNDRIAEPVRMELIPHFLEIKEAALEAGALGFGIAGAGPALFAFASSEKTAKDIEEAMREACGQKDLSCKTQSGTICPQGARIITEDEIL